MHVYSFLLTLAWLHVEISTCFYDTLPFLSLSLSVLSLCFSALSWRRLGGGGRCWDEPAWIFSLYAYNIANVTTVVRVIITFSCPHTESRKARGSCLGIYGPAQRRTTRFMIPFPLLMMIILAIMLAHLNKLIHASLFYFPSSGVPRAHKYMYKIPTIVFICMYMYMYVIHTCACTCRCPYCRCS